MNLKKIAASTAMAGALGSAALGVGAGLAQADPHVPNPPGPVCSGGPDVNCNGPSRLLPGQRLAPPLGHYNDPVGYGYPATWNDVPGHPGSYPVVFNPDAQAWGVYLYPGGPFIQYQP